MSITTPAVVQHPVLRGIGVLVGGCDALADANAWSLTDAELREALPELTRVLSRIGEVQGRLLAEADRRDLGQVKGYHDAAGWFAVATRTTRPVAKGMVKLARSLDDGRHEPTREALAAGRVLPEQARVIVEAVDALAATATTTATAPAATGGSEDGTRVGPEVVRRAEEHLIELAQDHDAKELRILGRRILEVVDPEAADEHERRLLEAEERRATVKASFSIHSDGRGMVRGRFAIPELAGVMLKKHLDALAAPKHRAAASPSSGPDTDTDTGTDPDLTGTTGTCAETGATGADTGPASGEPGGEAIGVVSRPLRLGEAFVEYITSRPVTPDGIPRAGGVPATVVVTMTQESLTGQLAQAGLLDTGERISAQTARMLACQAGIIPAVLGSRSQVLDLGRKTRFHTEPQRIAIGLRDQGCTEEHCDWPPGMCHIHHRIPWSRGGKTNVETGLMLCPRHHSLAHDHRYEMTDTMHGKVRFTRRT